MRYLLVYVFVLLFGTMPVLSQRILSLENPTKYKRHIFAPGDYIRFHTHDSGAKFSGIIEAIDDSVIVLVKQFRLDREDAHPRIFRDYVPLSEIKAVYLNKPSFWGRLRHGFYRTTLVGGSVVIVGTAVNTLTGGGAPDPTFMILSTSILTSGLIVRYLGRDKFKLGKKWFLKAMEPMVLPELEALKGGS
ncbi:MAG: hypothetical protein AAF587_11255 [Bacteroidota bacterium]